MIRLVDVVLHSVLEPLGEAFLAQRRAALDAWATWLSTKTGPEPEVPDYPVRREIAWVLQPASYLGRSALAKSADGSWVEGWLRLDTEEALGRVLETIGEDCRVVFA